MTNTAAPGGDPPTGRDDPTVAETLLASWGALAGAAGAALSMIPTSEDGRTVQEPLLQELSRSASRSALPAPDAAVTTRARRLVESTLADLREPAGARPYDTERAHRLRQRVLIHVVLSADEMATVELPPGSDEQLAVTGALRARELARDLLAEGATPGSARSGSA